MPTWIWHKDCWEYRIPLPQYNHYFAGGQIRPRKGGTFVYQIFGSTKDKITAKCGEAASYESAQLIIEDVWSNYGR